MLKPDLSKLNEVERQELIINLLFQNQSMLITLLNREADRMSAGGLIDRQAAIDFLQEDSRQAKRMQLVESYGFDVLPTEVENP